MNAMNSAAAGSTGRRRVIDLTGVTKKGPQ